MIKSTVLIVLAMTVLVSVAPAQTELSSSVAFDVEAATHEYLAMLTPEQRASSDAYYEGGYWLMLWGWLYTLLIAWALLHFRISTKFRDFSERLVRVKFIQQCIYIPLFLCTFFVLSSPFTIYRDFVREHAYGLSNLTFSGWLTDQLTLLAALLVIGTLSIAAIYWVIRCLSRTWTIWGSVVGIAMLGFLSVVAPVYISPLINDFQPLEEGPLKERIMSLARANGVPVDDIYQFDASRQTTAISANVSGMFGTTRISLTDNLLNRVSTAGVEAAVGHEIGHYALNHIPKGMIPDSILLLFAFVFLKIGFRHLNRPQWNVRGIDDIAGLPLLFAIMSTYIFLLTPVTNTLIRTSEAEADLFGLNAARQPDGWAEDVVLLSEYRKMEPVYWEEVFFFSHPSGYNRIRTAMQWKKENLGLHSGD